MSAAPRPVAARGVAEGSAALRRGCALLRGEDWGIFDLSGKDAADFLHRQLSNEIRSLMPGQGTPTCFLNREGRVLLYFNLWRTSEGFRAILWGKQRHEFIRLMDQFIFREEIVIKDRAEDLSSILICGPRSEEALRGFLRTAAPPAALFSITVNANGVEADLYGLDWLAVPVFQLVGLKEGLVALVGGLRPRGVENVGWDPFEVLRIEKGTAWPEFEVDDSLIPFECGLAHAVSLTKGCYVGQEILARMHNLGKPPRELRGLVFEGDKVPARGSSVLFEDIEIGRTLSSGFSDLLGRPIATASLRRKYLKAGTEIRVENLKGVVRDFPLTGDQRVENG